MGLDIAYFKNLKLIKDEASIKESKKDFQHAIFNPNIRHTHNTYTTFKENETIPKRLKRNKPYHCEEYGAFCAGSYSSFDDFREALCEIGGHVSQKQIWEPGMPMAFKEIIFHSDCEGYLDYKACGKLANDFMEFRMKAEEHFKNKGDDELWYRIKYTTWEYALRSASQRGLIVFC